MAAPSVRVAWDPNPEANIEGYRIYFGQAGSGSTSVLDVGNQTTGTVTGLAYSTSYVFYVTAYNTFGLESDPSESLAYTTPPFAPLSLSLDPDLIVLTPSEVTLRPTLGGEREPGTSLTITWQQTGGPEWLTIAGLNTLTPTLQLRTPGYYTLQITVTDGAKRLVKTTTLHALDGNAAASRPDPIVLSHFWIPVDEVIYFSWNGLTYRSYALAYRRQLGDRMWIPITPFFPGYTDHTVTPAELESFGSAFFSVFELP
jgi:hypothetical protein